MKYTGQEGSPLTSLHTAINDGNDEESEIDAGLDGDEEGRGEAEESKEITEWVGGFVFNQEEAYWFLHELRSCE